jgi:hypothetical protein
MARKATTRRSTSTRNASGRKTTRRSSATRTSSSRKRGFPSTPHTRTPSGRKIFEPIDKTPSERLEAGEKLPKYIANTRKRWEGEEVRELKTLAKKNTPTRVIGMKLGRSEDAVRAKARDEDISLRPANRSPYGPRSASTNAKLAANLRG